MRNVILYGRSVQCTNQEHLWVGFAATPPNPFHLTPSIQKLNLLFQNISFTFTGNYQSQSDGKTSDMNYIIDIQLFTPPHFHLSCLGGVGVVRCLLHNPAAARFAQPWEQSHWPKACPAGAADL